MYRTIQNEVNYMNDTILLTELKLIVNRIKTATDDTSKAVAQSEAIECLAKLFDNEAKIAVDMIEAKFETTQNRYGDYMAILGKFTGLYKRGFALAMIKNGGNKQGIQSAIGLTTNL